MTHGNQSTSGGQQALPCEIKLRVPKGRKSELQEIAQQSGDSLNAFIIKAIDAYINRAEE